MAYFNNVKDMADLKAQYRTLVKRWHPDNGGDVEVLKSINIEFDEWVKRFNAQRAGDFNEADYANASRKAQEKAREEARRREYEEAVKKAPGANYDASRPLKDITKIIREWLKTEYPDYKFSVRCASNKHISVFMQAAPRSIFKGWKDLTVVERVEFVRAYNNFRADNRKFADYSTDEQERVYNDASAWYKPYTEEILAMDERIRDFVRSYNWVLGLRHRFDYAGCINNHGENVEIVPPKTKKATTKKTTGKSTEGKSTEKKSEKATEKTTEKATEKETKKATEKETRKATTEKTTTEKATEKEDKTMNTEEKKEKTTNGANMGHETQGTYTYKIFPDVDTRDNSPCWIVKIAEKLSKDAYIAENRAMKERGAYYSKFKHGFLFRFDPTDILTA